jgi:hypothetical protein
MEILELVSSEAEDNGSLHSKTDFMNLRNLRPSAKLRERLITNQANHSAIDNLVRALVDLLPKPDGVWPLEERAKWLRLAAGIFDLGYKASDGERMQISVAAVEREAASAD